MKKIRQIISALFLAVLSVMASCTAAKSVEATDKNENLIIYYSPDAGNKNLLGAAKKYGSKVLYVYKNINGIAVTVPKGKTVDDAINYYGKVNGVLSVTKDQKMQLD